MSLNQQIPFTQGAFLHPKPQMYTQGTPLAHTPESDKRVDVYNQSWFWCFSFQIK